jgi:ribosomal protein L15E
VSAQGRIPTSSPARRPRVHLSRTDALFAGEPSGIVQFCQQWRKGSDAQRAATLTRHDANPRLPQAPTNSRQIQQFTKDLTRRWPEHLAGGYDPETDKNNGKGARLLAAALAAGCTIEIVRVWRGQQARAVEQRLKQRRKPGSLRAGAARSLKPLCPVCDPRALRRYPNTPDQPVPTARRFRPDPVVWNADEEWGRAFPHLAYAPARAAQT